jgi:hypothetical protein
MWESLGRWRPEASECQRRPLSRSTRHQIDGICTVLYACIWRLQGTNRRWIMRVIGWIFLLQNERAGGRDVIANSRYTRRRVQFASLYTLVYSCKNLIFSRLWLSCVELMKILEWYADTKRWQSGELFPGMYHWRKNRPGSSRCRNLYFL